MSSRETAPISLPGGRELPDFPPPDQRFKRRVNLVAGVREAFAKRELIRTLAEREYRVRYKQAVLGAAWAVFTPLCLMAVFVLFFHRTARIETDPAPYPLFAFIGLVPWTFFSTSVAQAGQSLLLNVPLLNKVYCPREVFPLGSIAVAALDSLIATGALVVLFVVFRYPPAPESLWVPLLLVIQVVLTVGVSLLVSIVMVFFRDLRHALPIILQLGLFATPVAYGIEAVPPSWQPLYVALNPLAAVIDGYRRTVLFGQSPDWALTAIGGASALTLLVVGYAIFKRLEMGIADVA